MLHGRGNDGHGHVRCHCSNGYRSEICYPRHQYVAALYATRHLAFGLLFGDSSPCAALTRELPTSRRAGNLEHPNLGRGVNELNRGISISIRAFCSCLGRMIWRAPRVLWVWRVPAISAIGGGLFVASLAQTRPKPCKGNDS